MNFYEEMLEEIKRANFQIENEMVRIWTKKIYDEFSHICYLHSLKLATPIFIVSDLPGRWGEWRPEERVIYISKELIKKFSWSAVVNVLKHEMAHMIVGEVFRIYDHTHSGPFSKACSMLGIASWASASEADLNSTVPETYQSDEHEGNQKLLARVEKLLALADSANEHEALLAMTRVRELYSKYNLEKLRSGADKSEYRTVVINHKKKIIDRVQSSIASILVSHFFVKVVYSSLYDANLNVTHKTIELLGTKENTMMAEYVFHFLHTKTHSMWHSYRIENSKTGKAKRSYLLGLLKGFEAKLSESATYKSKKGGSWVLNDENEKDTKSLILLSDHYLDEYVKNQFPRLVTIKRSSSHIDSGSYMDGTKDGRQIIINKPLERGHNGSIHGLGTGN